MLKSRKLMVLRIFDFLRNLYKQRNEFRFSSHLGTYCGNAGEQTQASQRPLEESFYCPLLHYRYSEGKCCRHLSPNLGSVLPQTEQMLYPSMTTSDFSTEIWKELICGTWRWRIQSPTSENFSSIVKTLSLSKLQI